MDRRDAIIGAAGLGLAGLAAARPDQQYYPAAGGQQIPGSRTGKIRANQVIITGVGPSAGLFVYSGTPGPGNSPVFSVVAPGVHKDPFGNPVDNIMAVGNEAGALTQIDGAGEILMYSPTTAEVIVISPVQQAMFLYSAAGAGAGTMIASIAVNGGTDSFGNQFLAGVTEYAPGSSAIQLLNGQINFYSFTTTWVLDQSDVGFSRNLQSTDTYFLKFGVTPVLQAALAGVTINGLETIAGASTSPVLTITNSTNSGGGTVSITAAATGNPVLLSFVNGDSHARLRADVKTNGGAISAGNGTNSPDTSIGRAAANQWASDYIAFDSTGGQVAEPWQAVTFANGWTNGLGVTAGYRRVAAPDHCVQWIGDYVTPAGLAAGQAVITAVPAAYRPITVQPILGVDVVTGGLVRFTMTAAGVLTYQSGSVAGHDISIPAGALVQLTQ